jgi:hypothetical protein
VSVELVNAVIPFLKGGWKCGLILHRFLASWTGGPLGWKSTQYGNNLRSVMKPKWDEYIFKEREYMEEEVSMGRFL